jgi:hypothetical protein
MIEPTQPPEESTQEKEVNLPVPWKILSVAVPLCFLGIAGQYYLFVLFIHWLGDPLAGINSLRPIRDVLIYREAQFLFFLYMILWMAVIVCFYLLYRWIILKGIIFLFKRSVPNVAVFTKKAFALLTPVLVLSWMTLAICPIESPKAGGGSSMQSVGDYTELAGYMIQMAQYTLMVLLALGVVAFTFMYSYIFGEVLKSDWSGWFIVSIFLSIGTVIGLGVVTYPLFEWIGDNISAVGGVFLIFGLYSMVSMLCIGMSRLNTRRKKLKKLVKPTSANLP